MEGSPLRSHHHHCHSHQNRLKLSPLFTLLLLSFNHARAGEPPQPPVKGPAVIELRDQYDAPQKLSFPTTNVVVLTIADHKGSEQIDGWVAALKTRYAGRIEIRGLADVRGVPGLWRGKVRKKFQETRTYPVMMDWSGTNCAQFACQPGVANVLVLARDGMVQARFSGSAGNAALKEAFAAVDAALAQSEATVEFEFTVQGR